LPNGLFARRQLSVLRGERFNRTADAAGSLGGTMVIHLAVAAFTARRLLQRECPICGHLQTVPPSKVHEVVSCERCDYAIAPERKIAA
jgi:hypothetical protein